MVCGCFTLNARESQRTKLNSDFYQNILQKSVGTAHHDLKLRGGWLLPSGICNKFMKTSKEKILKNVFYPSGDQIGSIKPEMKAVPAEGGCESY